MLSCLLPFYRNRNLQLCARAVLILWAISIVQANSNTISSYTAASEIADSRADELAQTNYRLCWQNKIEPANNFLTVKNDKVLLPQAGGALLAVSAATGDTLWRSDLGGEVSGQIVAGGELVFVATKTAFETENAVIIVRALSLETGVTVWRAEFPKADNALLIISDAALIAVLAEPNTGKNQVMRLDFASGDKIWTKQINAPPTAPVKLAANKIYLADNENSLRIFGSDNGNEIAQFRLPHPAVNLLAAENGTLLVGDQTGYVSSIRQTDGKKLWTLRLGAAAQQIILVANQILIASLDGFVYLHDADTGKRRWRRRLASRPFGAILVKDQAVLLIVSGADNHSFLSLRKGKTVGQINFPDKAFATTLPILAGETLVIGTSRGIVGWLPASASCIAD